MLSSSTPANIAAISEIKVNQSVVSTGGCPPEHVGRVVKVYQPAKNPMQSGVEGSKRWLLEFEAPERWNNPLMGWTSTADPLSNMKLKFPTSDAAIRFAEKNGWKPVLLAKNKSKLLKPKSYADNFKWKGPNMQLRRSSYE